MLSGHESKISSKEVKTTRSSKKEHIKVPKPNSSVKKVAVVSMVVSTCISDLLLLENLQPKDVLVSTHEQSTNLDLDQDYQDQEQPVTPADKKG